MNTEPRLSLDTSIQYVKGVGPHIAALLKLKDIETVEDALYFLPRVYEDRAHIKKIKELRPGERETSFGTIRSINLMPLKSKKTPMFVITIGDESGILLAKWFRYNLKYMKTKYKVGMAVVFSGEIKIFRYQREMTHPDIEVIEDPHDSLHFGRIVPIYSQTEGLHQKTIRRLMKHALDSSFQELEDPLPHDIRQRLQLLDLKTSFKEVHFPSKPDKTEARRRLVFDEFFFLELGLALKKTKERKEITTAFPPALELKKIFCSALPFELTEAQKKAIQDIEEDLSRTTPMNRMLQGDVGCGKTLVASLSACSVIAKGHQVALMVPTEILAEQHFKNLAFLFGKCGIQTALLKSDIKKSDRTQLLQEIKTGFFQFIVGTHALIQEGVDFKNLGYIIVDEQHRFGVEQRLTLKQKGNSPHLLVMTATPIPRTLSLTVYGDLDLSIIDEMPKGRKPVLTRVVREPERLKLYDFMKKELAKGKQAYVVYPLIEESEKVDLRNATQMSEHLKKIFPEFIVQLLHGKMDSEEKTTIMKSFSENKIHVLVSTTVIEVGIDVPNTTLMVVEHAERFGLSQLHQLRGRIGRGSDKSYCFLLAGYKSSEEAQQRLMAMEAHQSGFKIAEVDLAIRGPGEFLGTRQSGLPGFRVANLILDATTLIEARKEAFDLIERDPTLSLSVNASLKKALTRRWNKKIDFMSAG